MTSYISTYPEPRRGVTHPPVEDRIKALRTMGA